MIDFFLFWLPIVGTILLGSIAVAEWYSGVRVRAIWFGFGGTVCFLLVVALQWQKVLQDDGKPQGAHAYVFVDASEVRYLGTDRAVEGWVSLRNGGQAPARELRRIATIGAASYPFNDFNDVPVGEDRAVLGPGGAVDFGPMKMSRNLTPAETSAVISGNKIRRRFTDECTVALTGVPVMFLYGTRTTGPLLFEEQ